MPRAASLEQRRRRGLNLAAAAPAWSPAQLWGGGGLGSGDEMRVQTQAMRTLVCLTPSARSPAPLSPSTRKQRGQEGLNFG